MCGFHVSLLSKVTLTIWVSWLPPTILVAVYMMTSCGYIFPGVCILLNCPSVSTFSFLTPSQRLLVCFSTGWVLLEARLVSATLSCDRMSSLSLHLSLFLSCFFGVHYWLGCHLHLHSCLLAACLPVAISPYAFKVLQLSECPLHSKLLLH